MSTSRKAGSPRGTAKNPARRRTASTSAPADPNRWCSLNGRYRETATATVSVLDRGLLFGDGLFETWRTYNGRPFALAEHVQRMLRSARRLKMQFDPDEPWERRGHELLRRNGLAGRSALLRLTITRGNSLGALIPTGQERPTRLLLSRSLEPGLGELRRDGVSVTVLGASGSGRSTRNHKTTNYLPAVLAKTQARKRGAFEAIYSGRDGTLTEGTTSNLFIVRNGTVQTPPLDHGVLPGVTRAFILKLARRLGPVVEKRVHLEDLLEADEAFLTSTSIEAVPVLRVGRAKVGTGRPGEVTREVQTRYRKLVARRLGVKVDALDE